METEIWRVIPEFNGIYLVSNLGNVKKAEITVTTKRRGTHTFEEKMISQRHDKYGYKCVSLQKGKHRTSYTVHSLVAKAFLNKPENATQIDHIDGNKENNKVTNLEWVTAKENVRRAGLLGLRNYRSKSILRIKGNEVKRYETINEALEDNKISRSHLRILLIQEKMTKSGYLFIYEETASPHLVMCPEKIRRLKIDIDIFRKTLSDEELKANSIHFEALLALMECKMKNN
ncbi:MAG: NUMOD4 motif-containing HNH endonuclease [Alphaproteobacteria bacterium]|nr:NUMOD4 motif-containing HNH endonuclease [Alphaproteobacteria bacterium]